MTFDEKLTEENIPEGYPSQEELAKELLEHIKDNPQAQTGTDINYILYWKINVRGLENKPEVVQSYLSRLEENFTVQLEKFDCISFYEPVVDQPTSLTVVNTKTMKYVKI